MHDLISGIEFIFRGGFMMWPLLISALVALTVIFERLYSFKTRFPTPPALVGEVIEKVQTGDFTQANSLCGKAQTPSRKTYRGHRHCHHSGTADGPLGYNHRDDGFL